MLLFTNSHAIIMITIKALHYLQIICIDLESLLIDLISIYVSFYNIGVFFPVVIFLGRIFVSMNH